MTKETVWAIYAGPYMTRDQAFDVARVVAERPIHTDRKFRVIFHNERYYVQIGYAD